MKKIYLFSGPDTAKGFSKEIMKILKEDLKDSKTITFIASSPDKHEKNVKFVHGNEEIIGIIEHLKPIKKFDKISIIDSLNINKTDLENSDVIYLLGGNPKTQLEFINENNLNQILKDYNKIIIGASCGAMNLALKAYYSKDEDCDESFLYDAIGIVDITIDPHFNINNKEQVEEAKKMSIKHKIYGVPNESCIRLVDNSIELIGKVYIFENGNMMEVE